MTFSSIMITFYPTITGLCHAYFVIFDQNVICCIPENVIIRISRVKASSWLMNMKNGRRNFYSFLEDSTPF